MTKSFGSIKGNLRLAARYLGSIECSTNPEYKALEQELSEINLAMSGSDDIKERKTSLLEQKKEINKAIKAAEKSGDNTGSLNDSLSEINQKLEDIEEELNEFKTELKDRKNILQEKIDSYMKTWYNRADKLAKKYDELGENLPDESFLTEEEIAITKLARTLDGVFTGYGQHAAGTIISGDKLSDIIPLMWNDIKGSMETQCTMAQAEAKGLLKMDFLGLDNLNIITEIIRHPTNKKDMDSRLQDYVERDKFLKDPTIYEDIFCSGLTQGIFQFESPGMKKMLVEFKPESFEDIILLVATYRPGPMDYIPEITASKWYEKFGGDFQKYSEFIKRVYPFSKDEYNKKKKKGLAYFYDENGNMFNYVPHSVTLQNEVLQKILEPTYGCPVYQEQIMQIFRQMAGYSLGGADIVRRYMSKKKVDKLAKEKQAFIYGDEERGIPGCMKLHGISEKDADDLFEQMMPFAKYGFNKSHATAYAMVALFTAYLKKYHTADFFRSSLNAIKKLDEIPAFVKEMPFFGLEFKAPSMLNSKNQFSVEEDGKVIRYGLKYVKGFSEQNIHRSTSMQEFIENNPDVSLKIIEKYAQLGMFEECWTIDKKHSRTKGNRHECLRWLEKNGELLKEYSSRLEKVDDLTVIKNDLEYQLSFADGEDAEKLEKEINKIEGQITQWKKKARLSSDNLKNNRSEDYYNQPVAKETPEEILENREWEVEYLSMPFDINDSLELLSQASNKKDFNDLKVSKEINGSNTVIIPAIVLSISGEKKTKSGNGSYYDVMLMDRNKNIITRRFSEKPNCLDGEFPLMIDDCKYFNCRMKDYKPLISKSNQKSEYLSADATMQEKIEALKNGGRMQHIQVPGRKVSTTISIENNENNSIERE